MLFVPICITSLIVRDCDKSGENISIQSENSLPVLSEKKTVKQKLGNFLTSKKKTPISHQTSLAESDTNVNTKTEDRAFLRSKHSLLCRVLTRLVKNFRVKRTTRTISYTRKLRRILTSFTFQMKTCPN